MDQTQIITMPRIVRVTLKEVALSLILVGKIMIKIINW